MIKYHNPEPMILMFEVKSGRTKDGRTQRRYYLRCSKCGGERITPARKKKCTGSLTLAERPEPIDLGRPGGFYPKPATTPIEKIRILEKAIDPIKTIFAPPKGIELQSDDGILSFDEFSIEINDAGKVVATLWECDYGDRETPPDVYDSEFGEFDNVGAFMRAAWLHRAEVEFEARCEFLADQEFKAGPAESGI